MPRVFLNYRRDDSEGIAGRIFDRLRERFGPKNVFRDLDTIAPGAEFASVIGEEIAKCDALIAIIGNDWLEAKDHEGKRRLDTPRDFVRTEIAEALSRKKLVIPTLVDGVGMPGAKDLPAEIALLAERHAIEISSTRRRTLARDELSIITSPLGGDVAVYTPEAYSCTDVHIHRIVCVRTGLSPVPGR